MAKPSFRPPAAAAPWRRAVLFSLLLSWACSASVRSSVTSAEDLTRARYGGASSAGPRALATAIASNVTDLQAGSPEQLASSEAAPPPLSEPEEVASTIPAELSASGALVASLDRAASRRPALTPELERLRASARERLLRYEPHPTALDPREPPTDARLEPRAPRVNAERFVALENEQALANFHAALTRLRAGQDPDGKVRILAYGASHTQADLYTGYLRTYLQSRFGDGGQGFVLLGRVNRWYRTLDSTTRHRDLAVLHARYREDVSSEPLGWFGAALVGKRGGAYGELFTSKSSTSTRFELQYLAQPRGGDFSIYVDDVPIARLASRAVTQRPAYYSFETTPGAHHIKVVLAGNGPVRWFGVVGESEAPGVVVDTLGIGGSRITDQLRWREDFWAEAVRRRAPDLITFAYGTNESMDFTLPLERYEAELREVLARAQRAAPQASCVLITPFDLPSRARARLVRILDVQHRVARDVGCGLWDGYKFMGGQGSIRRWSSARPALAAPDHVHLTRRGYVYAGLALGDALMRAYDAEADQGAGSPRVAASSLSP